MYESDGSVVINNDRGGDSEFIPDFLKPSWIVYFTFSDKDDDSLSSDGSVVINEDNSSSSTPDFLKEKQSDSDSDGSVVINDECNDDQIPDFMKSFGTFISLTF